MGTTAVVVKTLVALTISSPAEVTVRVRVSLRA
jgi:hypothetical protein